MKPKHRKRLKALRKTAAMYGATVSKASFGSVSICCGDRSRFAGIDNKFNDHEWNDFMYTCLGNSLLNFKYCEKHPYAFKEFLSLPDEAYILFRGETAYMYYMGIKLEIEMGSPWSSTLAACRLNATRKINSVSAALDLFTRRTALSGGRVEVKFYKGGWDRPVKDRVFTFSGMLDEPEKAVIKNVLKAIKDKEDADKKANTLLESKARSMMNDDCIPQYYAPSMYHGYDDEKECMAMRSEIWGHSNGAEIPTFHGIDVSTCGTGCAWLEKRVANGSVDVFVKRMGWELGSRSPTVDVTVVVQNKQFSIQRRFHGDGCSVEAAREILAKWNDLNGKPDSIRSLECQDGILKMKNGSKIAIASTPSSDPLRGLSTDLFCANMLPSFLDISPAPLWPYIPKLRDVVGGFEHIDIRLIMDSEPKLLSCLDWTEEEMKALENKYEPKEKK